MRAKSSKQRCPALCTHENLQKALKILLNYIVKNFLNICHSCKSNHTLFEFFISTYVNNFICSAQKVKKFIFRRYLLTLHFQILSYNAFNLSFIFIYRSKKFYMSSLSGKSF